MSDHDDSDWLAPLDPQPFYDWNVDGPKIVEKGQYQHRIVVTTPNSVGEFILRSRDFPGVVNVHVHSERIGGIDDDD